MSEQRVTQIINNMKCAEAYKDENGLKQFKSVFNEVNILLEVKILLDLLAEKSTELEKLQAKCDSAIEDAAHFEMSLYSAEKALEEKSTELEMAEQRAKAIDTMLGEEMKKVESFQAKLEEKSVECEKLKSKLTHPDSLTPSEYQRLVEWINDTERKPANIAFTASTCRDAARAFEQSDLFNGLKSILDINKDLQADNSRIRRCILNWIVDEYDDVLRQRMREALDVKGEG